MPVGSEIRDATRANLLNIRRQSKTIGGKLAEAGPIFVNVFNNACVLIDAAEALPKPTSEAQLLGYLKPLDDQMEDIVEYYQGSKETDLAHAHLMALGAGLGMLQLFEWNNPKSEAAQVLKEVDAVLEIVRAKAKIDPIHEEFADAVFHCMKNTQSIIESSMPNGVHWKDGVGAPQMTPGSRSFSNLLVASISGTIDEPKEEIQQQQEQVTDESNPASEAAILAINAAEAQATDVTETPAAKEKGTDQPPSAEPTETEPASTESPAAPVANIAAPAAPTTTARSVDVDPDSPLMAFKAILDGPVATYVAQSEKIGGLVHEQALDFADAINEELALLNTVESTPKKSEDDFASMIEPLSNKLAKIADYGATIPPSDPMADHLMGVSESVGALGWIAVPSGGPIFISDMKASGEFYTSRVLMKTKNGPDAELHKTWATSYLSIFDDMKVYVKENHLPSLNWNTAGDYKASSGPATRQVVVEEEYEEDDEGEQGDDAVSAFKAIMDGPFAKYVEVANSIGDAVKDQANIFNDAMKEEFELIKKAAVMKKPSDDEFQEMIGPLATKLGEVAEFAQTVDPKGPMGDHVTGVAESVGALGWVAVPSGGPGFISDMKAAGEFYTSRVLSKTKKDADAEVHKEFVNNLMQTYDDMKAYVKQYHIPSISWDTGAGVVKPKAVKVAKKKKEVVYEEEDDDEAGGPDAVSKFQEIIDGPFAQYLAAANTIGDSAKEQANIFADAMKEEFELIKKAAGMKKPSDDEFQDMIGPLATKLGEVAEFAQTVDPKGPMGDHVTGVAESVGALGWVAVPSGGPQFVSDMKASGEFYTSRVLSKTKKDADAEVHKQYVTSLMQMYDDLKVYVKEFHIPSLSWDTGAGVAKPKVAGKKKKQVIVDDDDEASSPDAVYAFQTIIDGPFAKYVETSNTIGGPVKDQAVVFAGAMADEFELIKKAAGMTKPSDDEFQEMIGPLATKLGEVAEFAQTVDPKGTHGDHVTGIAESVGALGWVAVPNGGPQFVSDMKAAGEFYTSRVMAKTKKDPDTDVHKEWATSIMQMYDDMKDYVKQYHLPSLNWNTGAGQKKASTLRSVAVEEDEEEEEDKDPADPVKDFEKIIKGVFNDYMTTSATIGGPVKDQADIFAKAMNEELELLKKVATMKKVSDDEFQNMIGALATELGNAAEMGQSAHPKDPEADHLLAVAESIGALGWVAVPSGGVSFISDSKAAGEFYSTKVMAKTKKEADAEVHKKWATSLMETYDVMKAYVKQHHTPSLTWNTCA